MTNGNLSNIEAMEFRNLKRILQQRLPLTSEETERFKELQKKERGEIKPIEEEFPIGLPKITERPRVSREELERQSEEAKRRRQEQQRIREEAERPKVQEKKELPKVEEKKEVAKVIEEKPKDLLSQLLKSEEGEKPTQVITTPFLEPKIAPEISSIFTPISEIVEKPISSIKEFEEKKITPFVSQFLKIEEQQKKIEKIIKPKRPFLKQKLPEPKTVFDQPFLKSSFAEDKRFELPKKVKEFEKDVRLISTEAFIGFQKDFLAKPLTVAIPTIALFASGQALISVGIRSGAFILTRSTTLTQILGKQGFQKLFKFVPKVATGLIGTKEVAEFVRAPREQKVSKLSEIPLIAGGIKFGASIERKVFESVVIRQTRFGDPLSEIQRETSLQSAGFGEKLENFLRKSIGLAREARTKIFREPRPLVLEDLSKDLSEKSRKELLQVIQKEKPLIFGSKATEVSLPKGVARKAGDIDVFVSNTAKFRDKLLDELKKSVSEKEISVTKSKEGGFAIGIKGGEKFFDIHSDLRRADFPFLQKPEKGLQKIPVTSIVEQFERKIIGTIERRKEKELGFIKDLPDVVETGKFIEKELRTQSKKQFTEKIISKEVFPEFISKIKEKPKLSRSGEEFRKSLKELLETEEAKLITKKPSFEQKKFEPSEFTGFPKTKIDIFKPSELPKKVTSSKLPKPPISSELPKKVMPSEITDIFKPSELPKPKKPEPSIFDIFYKPKPPKEEPPYKPTYKTKPPKEEPPYKPTYKTKPPKEEPPYKPTYKTKPPKEEPPYKPTYKAKPPEIIDIFQPEKNKKRLFIELPKKDKKPPKIQFKLVKRVTAPSLVAKALVLRRKRQFRKIGQFVEPFQIRFLPVEKKQRVITSKPKRADISSKLRVQLRSLIPESKQAKGQKLFDLGFGGINKFNAAFSGFSKQKSVSKRNLLPKMPKFEFKF